MLEAVMAEEAEGCARDIEGGGPLKRGDRPIDGVRIAIKRPFEPGYLTCDCSRLISSQVERGTCIQYA